MSVADVKKYNPSGEWKLEWTQQISSQIVHKSKRLMTLVKKNDHPLARKFSYYIIHSSLFSIFFVKNDNNWNLEEEDRRAYELNSMMAQTFFM